MSQPDLTHVIAEALELPPEEVQPGSSSDTVAVWDSLKHLDVILTVEQSYNVKFKTAEIAQLVSVAKLEEALRQRNVL
jgi:acyl carrier protein